MKSIFLKKQGENPKNKILDFLITHSDLDYTLKEISKYSEAGYSSVKVLVKKLANDGWITPTRKISKIVLYKLNVNNAEVKKLFDFYWEVIDQKIEGKAEKNNNTECTSNISSFAATARH